MRKRVLAVVMGSIGLLWAASGAAAGEKCCQRSTVKAEGSLSKSIPAEARGQWIVDAAVKVAAEVSRWVEKMTFVDYSTQWSSWCAGNRAGCGSSQPCSTKGAQAGSKPCDSRMRCCDKPCPTQGAGPVGKSKGSS